MAKRVKVEAPAVVIEIPKPDPETAARMKECVGQIQAAIVAGQQMVAANREDPAAERRRLIEGVHSVANNAFIRNKAEQITRQSRLMEEMSQQQAVPTDYPDPYRGGLQVQMQPAQQQQVQVTRRLGDDPALDGTDFAHPAWWRGEEHATTMVVERLERIFAGGDDGSGVLNHDGLERLRRRILRLWEQTLPQPVKETFTVTEPVDPFIEAIRSFSRGNAG